MPLSADMSDLRSMNTPRKTNQMFFTLRESITRLRKTLLPLLKSSRNLLKASTLNGTSSMSMLLPIKKWVLGPISPSRLMKKLSRPMNISKLISPNLETNLFMAVLETSRIPEQLLFQSSRKKSEKRMLKNS